MNKKSLASGRRKKSGNDKRERAYIRTSFLGKDFRGPNPGVSTAVGLRFLPPSSIPVGPFRFIVCRLCPGVGAAARTYDTFARTPALQCVINNAPRPFERRPASVYYHSPATCSIRVFTRYRVAPLLLRVAGDVCRFETRQTRAASVISCRWGGVNRTRRRVPPNLYVSGAFRRNTFVPPPQPSSSSSSGLSMRFRGPSTGRADTRAKDTAKTAAAGGFARFQGTFFGCNFSNRLLFTCPKKIIYFLRNKIKLPIHYYIGLFGRYTFFRRN